MFTDRSVLHPEKETTFLQKGVDAAKTVNESITKTFTEKISPHECKTILFNFPAFEFIIRPQ